MPSLSDPTAAFILGNGPSLRSVPLESLDGVASIGMNAAYRHWEKINWFPTHYACLDEVLGLSHKEAIARLIDEKRVKRFLLRESLIEELGPIAQAECVENFDQLRSNTPILQTPSVTTGSSAACWAAMMGFQRLYIAGVDLDYVEIVDGARRLPGVALEIEHQTENPNYFFDDYQRPGDRYNIPNTRPDLHLNAWREAAWYVSQAGVETFNLNPNSKVECFAYMSIDSVLSGARDASPAKEPLRQYTVAALSKMLYQELAVVASLSQERDRLKEELERAKATQASGKKWSLFSFLRR